MNCVKDVDLFTAHNLSIKDLGGLGTASRRLPNGLVVGAIVAVNAVGEVRLPSTGEILAGARGEDGISAIACPG